MSIYKYVKAKVSNPRKVSYAGIAMLHKFEGLSLEAYPDPGSGAEPYTIGYGTTVIRGNPVKPDTKITLDEAELYFEEDLAKFEEAVRKAVTVPLTQNQFDALVSFTYNVGIGNFRTSTLLRVLNKGQYYEAADQLLRWNKASGKVMEGLSKRRRIEREHFLGD